MNYVKDKLDLSKSIKIQGWSGEAWGHRRQQILKTQMQVRIARNIGININYMQAC